MPCLGARKKSTMSSSSSTMTAQQSINRAASTTSHHTLNVAAQLKQENSELKTKNLENIEVVAKLTAEVEQLKKQLCVASLSVTEEKSNDNTEVKLLELEARNQEMAADLAEKEIQLEASQQQIEELKNKSNIDCSSQNESCDDEGKKVDHMMHLLEEKDRLLTEKQNELEELKLQWETERAELIKPALHQVNMQLEELKETNKIAVERLTEKENELAELRSELTRRDRKPKQSCTRDQENQRRLNRLTVDLENDRLLIQKLDELNQQLESQKKKHENTLEAHAKVIAEKDQALLQQQKSLKQLKIAHENATKSLEQEQIHNLRKLQLKHEKDMELLTKRLKLAENQAKSNVNDELDKILVEFEQSQHNHSVQVAHLQKSYQEQISFMKKGQQAELQSLISAATQKKNDDFANRRPSVSKLRDSKFTWPPVAATPITS